MSDWPAWPAWPAQPPSVPTPRRKKQLSRYLRDLAAVSVGTFGLGVALASLVASTTTMFAASTQPVAKVPPGIGGGAGCRQCSARVACTACRLRRVGRREVALARIATEHGRRTFFTYTQDAIRLLANGTVGKVWHRRR